jgi:3',5'-cyclic AMP phosphodiesterase CpdA
LRIAHLSDIHVWKYDWRPWQLAGKRAVGIMALLAGRSRRFRLERLDAVVERVLAIRPDHVLITGDLTTTALVAEFQDVRRRLGPLLEDPDRATVLPGNHDRYTPQAVRERRFEAVFGAFAPATTYPWLRWLDSRTAILGLDPSRAHLTAIGRLPKEQLAKARDLLARDRPHRLIVACHYPLAAPLEHQSDLRCKRLVNAAEVAGWLNEVGPHLYCCGHVHAAWSFTPPGVPGQLCLNAGAPLLHDPSHNAAPGFLQIDLHEDIVDVTHHAWSGSEWSTFPMVVAARTFGATAFVTSNAISEA